MTASDATDSIGTLEVAPSLRERVYGALEESILDGVLHPGSHLREDDLAKRLGVSLRAILESDNAWLAAERSSADQLLAVPRSVGRHRADWNQTYPGIWQTPSPRGRESAVHSSG